MKSTMRKYSGLTLNELSALMKRVSDVIGQLGVSISSDYKIDVFQRLEDIEVRRATVTLDFFTMVDE